MKCANPICGVESLYFRSGSLHCIDSRDEIRGNHTEAGQKLIWLCGECTKSWSVETWRKPGQQLRRRFQPAKDLTG
jgi:hypothetical protein